MTGSEENLHELSEEVKSYPEAETVNTDALHDSLEAENEYNTTDIVKPIEDAILTAGDSSERTSESDEASANDHSAGTIATSIESDSLTGWVTKSKCCDDLNKKLFGTENETEPEESITENYRDNSSSGKDNDLPDFERKLDFVIDRLDDFAHDFMEHVDKTD